MLDTATQLGEAQPAATPTRPELRAFPRLACGRDAGLAIGGWHEDSQVIDVSRGGCKVLPRDLARLAELRPLPGSTMVVELAGHQFTGHLVWATPNYSALGCAFDEVLTETQVAVLVGLGAPN